MMLALLAPCVALGTELPGSLQAIVERAEGVDLPTAPLEQKALEGVAKGVDEARISAVLGELLSEWRAADQLLGERARAADRDDLVPAAAAALHQGASAEAVVALASRSRPTEALWALSDVLYAGMPAPDARRLVEAALANDQPGVALRELPEAARLLVAADGPASAAQLLRVALAGGSTPLAAVADAGPGHAEGKSKGGGRANGNGGSNGNANGHVEGKAGGKSP